MPQHNQGMDLCSCFAACQSCMLHSYSNSFACRPQKQNMLVSLEPFRKSLPLCVSCKKCRNWVLMSHPQKHACTAVYLRTTAEHWRLQPILSFVHAQNTSISVSTSSDSMLEPRMRRTQTSSSQSTKLKRTHSQPMSSPSLCQPSYFKGTGPLYWVGSCGT